MDVKNNMKKLKNTLIYLGILSLIGFLRFLSRENAIAFMRAMGKIAFVLAAHERKNTIKHLTMAFAKEKTAGEIEELARKVFMNLSVCITDAIRLPVMVKDGSLDDLVTAEGFQHFTNAAESGKGLIAMTGHYGNWELLGTWIVKRGYPIKVVAKKSYDPRLDKLIVDYRNQAGYANTARGSATRSVVDGLMRGETFGLLFDLDTKVKGVFVNFFGTPAHTATIPAILAAKLNVPIVPIFIRLTSDYKYVVMCREELKLVNTGNEEQDVVTNTQICSDMYEEMIKKHPEQWIWMHRRWKKKPEDFAVS